MLKAPSFFTGAAPDGNADYAKLAHRLLMTTRPSGAQVKCDEAEATVNFSYGEKAAAAVAIRGQRVAALIDRMREQIIEHSPMVTFRDLEARMGLVKTARDLIREETGSPRKPVRTPEGIVIIPFRSPWRTSVEVQLRGHEVIQKAREGAKTTLRAPKRQLTPEQSGRLIEYLARTKQAGREDLKQLTEIDWEPVGRADYVTVTLLTKNRRPEILLDKATFIEVTQSPNFDFRRRTASAGSAAPVM